MKKGDKVLICVDFYADEDVYSIENDELDIFIIKNDKTGKRLFCDKEFLKLV